MIELHIDYEESLDLRIALGAYIRNTTDDVARQRMQEILERLDEAVSEEIGSPT